ncbi:MAG: GIY-YIG nuclease family protein [Candidatus Staskawiczbacteria bacterium]|jgi:excinuclease ABC subunit C
MEKFIFLQKEKLGELPRNTGIYAFKGANDLIYIGKAADIRERVKNHFQQPTYRDDLFIDQIKNIGYIRTNSEIEALLLEAQLIKKYQPKFNVIWRDDKNYFYIAITKEALPKIFITHQPKAGADHVGPFVDGKAVKETLRFLRKIFPYYTKKHPAKLCPWCHLGLCPGPDPDPKEYQKSIRNLMGVLEGKKRKTILSLQKEIKLLSKNQNYEKAAKVRDQIFALEKIISNARIFKRSQPLEYNWDATQKLLQKIILSNKSIKRIEGYDISNTQGKQATASMVVFTNGQPDKNEYKKFKIRITDEPNDVAMIKEALKRRLNHPEWPYPDLILIDGGKPQLNAAKSVVDKAIPIIALAKRRNELYIGSKKTPVLLKKLPREIFNLILQIRDESHRFAIAYHKKLREKHLLFS